MLVGEGILDLTRTLKKRIGGMEKSGILPKDKEMQSLDVSRILCS